MLPITLKQHTGFIEKYGAGDGQSNVSRLSMCCAQGVLKTRNDSNYRTVPKHRSRSILPMRARRIQNRFVPVEPFLNAAIRRRLRRSSGCAILQYRGHDMLRVPELTHSAVRDPSERAATRSTNFISGVFEHKCSHDRLTFRTVRHTATALSLGFLFAGSYLNQFTVDISFRCPEGPQPIVKVFRINIENRCDVQGQQLRAHQPSYDGQTQRAASFRTRP